MFWRFGGYSNVSTIDTLLEKSDVSLEELLDESDLIQELKSHNTKLIEFLRDENTLSRLLKYVIARGPHIEDDEWEDDDEDEKGKSPSIDADARKKKEEEDKAEKQRLKYAYVACEILSCETWSITEALMSNVPHLTEFWDFLRQSPPLDPLQAGYFTKVNETLLEKKTEDMLEMFKSLPGVVPAILQHVDCPMVMDLLLKIISLEKAEGGHGIVDWLQSQDLIPSLLSNLSPECNSSTQTSAGDFLKAIITISANAAQNEQSCIGPNSLTRQLVSEPCMKSLIGSMLKGGNPLTVGVGIVIEVIRKNNSDYDPENGHNPDSPPTSHDPIYLGTLLRMFAQHVPDFMELILSSKHTVTVGEKTKIVERGKLSSAWGTDIEPLGFDRFKTCELMAELLHCSNMGLLNEKGGEEFMKERDAERERLRAQGAFTLHKEAEDSAVDLSIASSTFENGLKSSIGGSTDDFRMTNNSEDDGFEKVGAADVSDENNVPSLMDESTFAHLNAIAGSPSKKRVTETSKSQESSLLSPTSAEMDERVRRLSLEDTPMTSPPAELVEITSGDAASDPRSGEISPHPDDKPAALFASKKVDPNKTPTSMSPNTPGSPTAFRHPEGDQSLARQIESERSNAEGDSMVTQESLTHSEAPVVGDYLKIMFVENQVVPTILSFFFRFPWNNFLHNVVYDVVQQVFNGPMDRGHNRFLAFDLFETGKITEQIINGQKRSDEAQQTKNMRLGYMGHLTLVAEEVVKFGERHPRDILTQPVQEFVYGREWEEYVTKTLAETRDRDNAILGGVRPQDGLGPRQAVLNAVNAGQGFGSNALANAGLNGGQQGLDSIDLSNTGSATSSGANSLVSDFGNSSDDDDEDMDDSGDDEQQRGLQSQLASVDMGMTDSSGPLPLIPPPPAPLNIVPSRARRRLATRLAMHKQQAEQEAAASEFGAEGDDPFASLDDADQDATDPFSLDEEEQDITAFGARNNTRSYPAEQSESHLFSVSRGLSGLFSSVSPTNSRNRAHENADDFDASSSSSSGSNASDENERTPMEARTSDERRPLDIDDDEEMGEMVAPTEEGNSSDEEVLSPTEKAQLRGSFSAREEPVSEFDGQGDYEDDDDDSEGDGLVEIAMPAGRRNSGHA
jgi:SIT4-associating protein SAP185/190